MKGKWVSWGDPSCEEMASNVFLRSSYWRVEGPSEPASERGDFAVGWGIAALNCFQNYSSSSSTEMAGGGEEALSFTFASHTPYALTFRQ